ncbi:MAG: DUF3078 domain-containing protein [Bacteroidales bacterium]
MKKFLPVLLLFICTIVAVGSVSATMTSSVSGKKQTTVGHAKVDNHLLDYLKKMYELRGDTIPAALVVAADTLGIKHGGYPITDYIMSVSDINLNSERIADPMFLSLVFGKYEAPRSVVLSQKVVSMGNVGGNNRLKLDDNALERFSVSNADIVKRNAYLYVLTNHPENVKYTTLTLPAAPKPEKSTRPMRKNMISINTPPPVPVTNLPLETPPPPKLWKNHYTSSIQVSEAYISANWYQGGESNFNLISDQLYTVNFDNKKKLLFSTSVQWKLGINTAPSDSVHKLRINEDLFQINSMFGIKAFKSWYYTVSMQFKTQFFNSFETNSNKQITSAFSPGELNIGLGLSYNRKIEPRKFETSIMFAPLSYNLKFALREDLAAKAGIADGKLFVNQVGSSFEANFKWEFYRNLSWNARIFYFTNYKYILSDLETGMNFAFNRYFSTRIYLHARYDDSVAKNKRGNHLQFKQLLSFGFNYKF